MAIFLRLVRLRLNAAITLAESNRLQRTWLDWLHWVSETFLVGTCCWLRCQPVARLSSRCFLHSRKYRKQSTDKYGIYVRWQFSRHSSKPTQSMPTSYYTGLADNASNKNRESQSKVVEQQAFAIATFLSSLIRCR